MKKLKSLCFLVSLFTLGTIFYSCEKERLNELSSEVSLKNGSTLTPLEQLGKLIFFDDNLSNPIGMSCATCHGSEVGYTGPNEAINMTGAVYEGAVTGRFGNRKPPSAAYATFSPILYMNVDGDFIGGNFWDGRATGEVLGNPAADQARGPFLNPVEMNNPSKQAVLEKIASSTYASLWETVWGEPLVANVNVDANYDRIGLTIAAFEASSEVNQFSSKYDAFLAGEAKLTGMERLGMVLFNGKAHCSNCHPSSAGTGGEPPLFTDFTYENVGVPKNPANPWYTSEMNSEGENWVDYGLGFFLSAASYLEPYAAENMGKHKVPTLRNVDKRFNSTFTKAYMHNGVFKSLNEVVHFYNTRDVETWAPPEVSENINTEELGNLGLNRVQEDAIVAFLMTLSDGYE